MQRRDSGEAKDESMNLDGDMLSELCCPIYQEPYQDATLYTDGRVYSRAAINEYKKNNPRKAKESPITRVSFEEVKFANGAQHVLKEKFETLIKEYKEKRQEWSDKLKEAEKEEKVAKEKLAHTEKELLELRQKIETLQRVTPAPTAVTNPIEEIQPQFTFHDVSLPYGCLMQSFHDMKFNNAIKKRNFFETRYYLSQGANPNTIDHETQATALIQVVIKRKDDPENALDIINMLLTHPNINLDAQDQRGNTALHHAASLNDNVVVDLLLAKNANRSLLNNYGDTACRYGLRINKEYFDRGIFNKLNITKPLHTASQPRLFAARATEPRQANAMQHTSQIRRVR